MLIYISGAITNNENYQAEFQKAEQWLMLKGHTPINPARFITNFPKLTLEQIMKIDYCLLEMCDGIFMLGGWQNSKGACAELSYAKSLGKKPIYQKYYERKDKKMKLEQYKAIVDFCKENGFTQETFLNDLREWGDLDENSPIEDLAECVQDETYETMYNYLVENYG
jgi:hypothetical protein